MINKRDVLAAGIGAVIVVVIEWLFKNRHSIMAKLDSTIKNNSTKT